jgi:hypothetical protein
MMASGEVTLAELERRNSIFSGLDPSKIRIVSHSAEVRIKR